MINNVLIQYLILVIFPIIILSFIAGIILCLIDFYSSKPKSIPYYDDPNYKDNYDKDVKRYYRGLK